MWHAVDALWITGAGNINVAPPDQLAALFLGEDRTQHFTSPSLRLPHGEAANQDPPKRQEPNSHSQNVHERFHVHPPMTRGTIIIWEACASNCSSRSTGLPASTRKAVAPRARSRAKIRSAS